MAQFPEDQAGNTALAQHLWGYNLFNSYSLCALSLAETREEGLRVRSLKRGIRFRLSRGGEAAARSRFLDRDRGFAGVSRGVEARLVSSRVVRRQQGRNGPSVPKRE